MHKRNIIAIILTAVIFVAAVVLGVSTVYRVNAVTLDVSLVSEAAKAEADELQKLLLKRYEDESIFSVKENDAEEDFAQFPYFRMTSFKKAYPNRLVISASEDTEVFAVENDGEYYILGADGTILGIRGNASNRSDGADNIIVKGLSASGKRGEIIGGDECIPLLLTVFETLSNIWGGARSNVVSVEVMRPTTSAEDTYFCFMMREGVKAYIRNPGTLTVVKAEKFAEFYLSLEDTERLGGRIEVTDDAVNPGNVRVFYSKND